MFYNQDIPYSTAFWKHACTHTHTYACPWICITVFHIDTFFQFISQGHGKRHLSKVPCNRIEHKITWFGVCNLISNSFVFGYDFSFNIFYVSLLLLQIWWFVFNELIILLVVYKILLIIFFLYYCHEIHNYTVCWRCNWIKECLHYSQYHLI